MYVCVREFLHCICRCPKNHPTMDVRNVQLYCILHKTTTKHIRPRLLWSTLRHKTIRHHPVGVESHRIVDILLALFLSFDFQHGRTFLESHRKWDELRYSGFHQKRFHVIIIELLLFEM